MPSPLPSLAAHLRVGATGGDAVLAELGEDEHGLDLLLRDRGLVRVVPLRGVQGVGGGGELANARAVAATWVRRPAYHLLQLVLLVDVRQILFAEGEAGDHELVPDTAV